MKKLESLIEDLGFIHHAGPRDADCQNLSDDSRTVTPGTLFISRGTPDNQATHIRQALDQGASALISEPIDVPDVPKSIPWFHHDRVDQPLAGTIAERFFDEPAKRLRLVGLTGTNGKTTTSFSTPD